MKSLSADIRNTSVPRRSSGVASRLMHRLATLALTMVSAQVGLVRTFSDMHQAGRETVAEDAVVAAFARDAPRQRDDGAFRRHIMQHHRRALEHRARRDVDDLAVMLTAHRRQHRLHAFERAADIDRHHAIEFRGVDLVDPLQRQIAEQRRVVDEAVHAAERGFGRRDEPPDRRAVGDVAGHAEALAAGLFDDGDRRVGRLQIAHGEPRAFRRQRLSVGRADALRRSGNDDRPPVQSVP